MGTQVGGDILNRVNLFHQFREFIALLMSIVRNGRIEFANVLHAMGTSWLCAICFANPGVQEFYHRLFGLCWRFRHFFPSLVWSKYDRGCDLLLQVCLTESERVAVTVLTILSHNYRTRPYRIYRASNDDYCVSVAAAEEWSIYFHSTC